MTCRFVGYNAAGTLRDGYITRHTPAEFMANAIVNGWQDLTIHDGDRTIMTFHRPTNRVDQAAAAPVVHNSRGLVDVSTAQADAAKREPTPNLAVRGWALAALSGIAGLIVAVPMVAEWSRWASMALLWGGAAVTATALAKALPVGESTRPGWWL